MKLRIVLLIAVVGCLCGGLGYGARRVQDFWSEPIQISRLNWLAVVLNSQFRDECGHELVAAFKIPCVATSFDPRPPNSIRIHIVGLGEVPLSAYNDTGNRAREVVETAAKRLFGQSLNIEVRRKQLTDQTDD
jgi:hypothetical protein